MGAEKARNPARHGKSLPTVQNTIVVKELQDSPSHLNLIHPFKQAVMSFTTLTPNEQIGSPTSCSLVLCCGKVIILLL